MKIPSTCVIDTSVLVKPALNEPDAKIVSYLLYLKENFRLSILVPDIFRYEFLNTVGRKKSYAYAAKAFHSLAERQLSILRLEEDITKIASNILAKHGKISFYDAAFHALAKAYKTVFITADEKYYNLVRPTEKDVILLSDVAE